MNGAIAGTGARATGQCVNLFMILEVVYFLLLYGTANWDIGCIGGVRRKILEANRGCTLRMCKLPPYARMLY